MRVLYFIIFVYYILHIVACRPIARQHIPNTHQWTNWEAVFSTRSAWQLRDATIEELLGEVILCDPCRGQMEDLVSCEAVAGQ
jgi:hypothetical protein